MIIERDYADEAKNSSVDSGVDITYSGLSYGDVDPGLTVTLPLASKQSIDDDLNGAIYYPSGASVGKEGFDE